MSTLIVTYIQSKRVLAKLLVLQMSMGNVCYATDVRVPTPVSLPANKYLNKKCKNFNRSEEWS